jgi:hypothetical protein
MAFNPLAAGELVEQRTIKATGSPIVHVFGCGLHAQSGKTQSGMQALGVAFKLFAINQQGKPFLEAELGSIWLTTHLFESSCHSDQPKLAQTVSRGVSEQDLLLMVVVSATNVAVLDWRLVRHGLRAMGAVEVVAQD